MIKTVSLTADTETKVEIPGGYNVGIINRTTGMLYASRKSGISAGADDVAAIPAGDSYTIRAADDTVYLLATAAGDVQLESIGAKEVFKIAAVRSSSGGGEGGAVDAEARVAIETHANNTQIHLTEAEAIKAAASTISNPNSLINPNFRINQRGKMEYIAGNSWGAPIYCVDGWIAMTDTLADIAAGTNKVTVNDDGTATITVANSYWTRLYQLIENPLNGGFTVTAKIKSATAGVRFDILTAKADHISEATIGANVLDGGEQIITATADFADVSAIALNLRNDFGYGSATVEWVKLECGGASTLFSPPDVAVELAKCQRYYQIRSTGDIAPNDLRPTMATITDIKERSDGLYEYIAELR